MIITNLEVYGKADTDAEIETIDSFSITLRAPNGREGAVTLTAEEFVNLLRSFNFLATKHNSRSALTRKVYAALSVDDETLH